MTWGEGAIRVDIERYRAQEMVLEQTQYNNSSRDAIYGSFHLHALLGPDVVIRIGYISRTFKRVLRQS